MCDFLLFSTNICGPEKHLIFLPVGDKNLSYNSYKIHGSLVTLFVLNQMPSEPLLTMAVGNAICYELRAACLCENQGYTAKIGRGMVSVTGGPSGSQRFPPQSTALPASALTVPAQRPQQTLRGLRLCVKLLLISGSHPGTGAQLLPLNLPFSSLISPPLLGQALRSCSPPHGVSCHLPIHVHPD